MMVKMIALVRHSSESCSSPVFLASNIVCRWQLTKLAVFVIAGFPTCYKYKAWRYPGSFSLNLKKEVAQVVDIVTAALQAKSWIQLKIQCGHYHNDNLCPLPFFCNFFSVYFVTWKGKLDCLTFFCENLQFCSLLLIKVREVPAAANTNKSQRKLGAGSVFAKIIVSFKPK